MKKIFTLLLVLLAVSVKAQKPSIELLNSLTLMGLKAEVKADYGTLDNPLPSGAFMHIEDRAAMQTQMRKLKNSYRWPDGSALDFSKRSSMQGKGGIVDMYTIAHTNGKDTVRLFVDPYHNADTYFVPKGLVALNGALLAKELAPLVKMAEELYKAPDASILKESAAQLMGALTNQIGTDILIDEEAVRPILSDKEADKQLGSYLLRTYIFTKFLAYSKNIKDPKQYATKKVRENFTKFNKLHPEVNSGTLKDTLK